MLLLDPTFRLVWHSEVFQASPELHRGKIVRSRGRLPELFEIGIIC